MHMAHIAQVDLNLLGPLTALLEQRHVTRAAVQAGLSPSAMSRALGRLRDVFDDELLARGPGGYQLTPRAERIQRDLVALIPRLEILLASEVFTPRTAEETFRLVGTDYPFAVFGASLVRHVYEQSPGSTLQFDSWHDGALHDIETGRADLIFIGVAAPPNLRVQPLFTERFVCVLSTDHPLADRAGLTLPQYARGTHVLITIEQKQQGALDENLHNLGITRTVGMTVPYTTLAATVVAGTPLIATVPESLTELLADDPALCILRAPREIDHMTLAMAWHPRLDHDAAHGWMREMIRSVAADTPTQ
jgi:DNA-binding transcriptional LysR family regulator